MSAAKICFICASNVGDYNFDGATSYSCPRCGLLRVTSSAEAVLPSLRERATAEKIDAVSHLARSWKRNDGNYLNVTSEDANRWFSEARLAKPLDQVRNLIIWLGTNRSSVADPSTRIKAMPLKLASIVGGRATPEAMNYLVAHVTGEGLLEDNDSRGIGRQAGIFDMRLTFKGWEFLEMLMRQTAESRTAFMAMAFRNERLNEVYRDCFVPAISDAGFELRRLDDRPEAGLIDDQIRVAIRTAKFLIADLTTGNQGAYWEAGFAEGLGKKVIYVCEDVVLDDPEPSKRPHFDTDHLQRVKWSMANLEKARSDLTAIIRNTFPGEAKMS